MNKETIADNEYFNTGIIMTNFIYPYEELKTIDFNSLSMNDKILFWYFESQYYYEKKDFEITIKKLESILKKRQENFRCFNVHLLSYFNLYLQVAISYSKLNNMDRALNAFKKAWEYQFEENKQNKIQKNNLLQFRKIDKYLLTDLINNQISLSSPKNFNDPFDCYIFEWLKNEKTNYNKEAYLRSLDYFKIGCFAPKINIKNILLWSHYANCHKGVCIEYNFDNMNNVKNNFHYPYFTEVKYDKFSLKDFKGMTNQVAFGTKNKEWKYEREIRLIHFDSTFNKDYISLPLNNFGKIKAVYFGLKCTDDDMNLINRILNENFNNYYKMEVEKKSLNQLTFKKINFEKFI